MGDAYVNMTLENIANDDPMAVYKKASETDMFLGITINNIRVSLMAFSFGVLAGVGTVFLIMQNAIMLGSFQYFFYEKRPSVGICQNDLDSWNDRDLGNYCSRLCRTGSW